eukprot:3287703-Prymnesium_polylepis.1
MAITRESTVGGRAGAIAATRASAAASCACAPSSAACGEHARHVGGRSPRGWLRALEAGRVAGRVAGR